MRAPTLPLAPEVLAQDPDPAMPTGARRVAAVGARALVALLLAPVGLLAWPPYLLLRLLLPRPPLLSPPGRFAHVARLVATTEVPPPGLAAVDRVRLLVDLALTFALAPLTGLAWMLDELLFARELAANPVRAPVFEVSAWRSGSTSLAHALHDDPGLAAPNMLQMVLPYLWLWRLARALLGGRVDPAWVAAKMRAALPPDFLERHEADPWRTDTYDVLFFRHHLVPFAMTLGPAVTLQEFSHPGVTPSTRGMWEDDFPRMLDGLGRRTLAFAGGGPRRFFLKGHFLAAAPALAARWPDATFVTVVRPPLPRLRSTLNYLRFGPDFFGMGPMPWPWIAGLAPGEVAYDRAERAWFTRDDGVNRCVVPFRALVDDLRGALDRVYRALGRDGVPPEVPRAHAPRHAGPYRVDHSLAALGVDEAAVAAELAGYSAWVDGLR